MTFGLETQVIGRPLLFYDKVESTNDIARNLAQKGALEGTCVVADSQTSGKGRMGRVWESPPGVNLYISIILRPSLPPQKAFQITFLAANAVIETINKIVSLETRGRSPIIPEIKWPNDILINNRKAAGILTEMNSRTDGIDFIILGIGINLNMTEGMFPEGIRPLATSIRLETEEETDRKRFAGLLLWEIEKGYNTLKRDGFVPILNYWKRHSCIHGKKAVVKQLNGEETEGTILGVDEDGVLCLKKDGGEVIRLLSGDLIL